MQTSQQSEIVKNLSYIIKSIFNDTYIHIIKKWKTGKVVKFQASRKVKENKKVFS